MCANVDAAFPVFTHDKVEIWKDLQFSVLFKGDDWLGAEKGKQLEQSFAGLGVEIVYFAYGNITSSSALRRTLRNIDELAHRVRQGHTAMNPIFSIRTR